MPFILGISILFRQAGLDARFAEMVGFRRVTEDGRIANIGDGEIGIHLHGLIHSVIPLVTLPRLLCGDAMERPNRTNEESNQRNYAMYKSEVVDWVLVETVDKIFFVHDLDAEQLAS